MRLQKQQEKHLEEQTRLQYLHQLEIEKNEKEIIQLKNQNLQTQLESKNSELATNAMSLVQKGELLSRIKEELVVLKNNSENGRESKEFKKVITTINKELEINNDWDKFAGHFDEVHTNFLTILKKQYPALTSAELKLCAYLRLNLSSKEIAQLMGISTRGVETSRYRIRKKFGLSGEQNLFDVLFSIGTPSNNGH
jgi:DNA-binding CsgD family transcriptional regulator